MLRNLIHYFFLGVGKIQRGHKMFYESIISLCEEIKKVQHPTRFACIVLLLIILLILGLFVMGLRLKRIYLPLVMCSFLYNLYYSNLEMKSEGLFSFSTEIFKNKSIGEIVTYGFVEAVYKTSIAIFITIMKFSLFYIKKFVSIEIQQGILVFFISLLISLLLMTCFRFRSFYVFMLFLPIYALSNFEKLLKDAENTGVKYLIILSIIFILISLAYFIDITVSILLSFLLGLHGGLLLFTCVMTFVSKNVRDYLDLISEYSFEYEEENYTLLTEKYLSVSVILISMVLMSSILNHSTRTWRKE